MPYTAIFHSVGADSMIDLQSRTFDVTPEITALKGGIPKADTRGSDLLQYATHAPDWIKKWTGGDFSIEVKET